MHSLTKSNVPHSAVRTVDSVVQEERINCVLGSCCPFETFAKHNVFLNAITFNISCESNKLCLSTDIG